LINNLKYKDFQFNLKKNNIKKAYHNYNFFYKTDSLLLNHF